MRPAAKPAFGRVAPVRYTGRRRFLERHLDFVTIGFVGLFETACAVQRHLDVGAIQHGITVGAAKREIGFFLAFAGAMAKCAHSRPCVVFRNAAGSGLHLWMEGERIRIPRLLWYEGHAAAGGKASIDVVNGCVSTTTFAGDFDKSKAEFLPPPRTSSSTKANLRLQQRIHEIVKIVEFAIERD